MSKAIDSGMYNIANYSKTYSSDNDIVSTSKNEIHFLDDMKELLTNIRREKKDFDLKNWIDCNNLKGKTEREIYTSLSAQYNKNTILHNQCLSTIKKLEPIIKDTFPDHGYPSDSLSDFFYEVKQSIVVGKNDYLDVLKDIFSHYMDYVKELRTAMTTISQYTKAGKKDGYISINYVKFYGELKNCIEKYRGNEKECHLLHEKLLFTPLNDGAYVREVNDNKIFYSNKEQINKSIGAIERTLKEIKGINTIKTYSLNEKDRKNLVDDNVSLLSHHSNINVFFTCKIDFSDIEKLMKNFEPYLLEQGILLDNDIENKKNSLMLENEIRQKERKDMIARGEIYESIQHIIDVDNEIFEVIKENNKKIEESFVFNDKLQTEFDLFKKSLDSLEKKINANLDELSKKYSSANSNYDNFVKVVSNTMNTLLEMAKGFLRF
ncbi:IpaD/SipD/SspD family type III secretion system needle tip protein [Proteus columbae]|uniref:IpaD/SipD/SspD family type III secretion system needle tip protein n=1 Tax=Proteus columbae TaxID=1987580 RepID=UPI00288934D1|nr:IpaD/SipD/SspD family type III secretion system needle tip protein [Proteus columbae]